MMPPFESAPTRGHLLLVEDLSVLREWHVATLRKAGYAVATAEAAEEAVAFSRTEPLDVVILHSDRASLQDASFIETLRIARPDLKILVLADESSLEQLRSLEQHGATVVGPRTMAPAKWVETAMHRQTLPRSESTSTPSLISGRAVTA